MEECRMPASDPALRAASTRAAALARHRSPNDPALAQARRELRRVQLEADVRALVAKHAAAAERDALLAPGQDGAR
jgi:hypothetical protein